MPWRKPFRPPRSLAPAALAQRAYEVWISEVMLQQTRVQTVVG
jgi:A/G-specific adenine glycosylase